MNKVMKEMGQGQTQSKLKRVGIKKIKRWIKQVNGRKD